MNKTNAMKIVETKHGIELTSFLRTEYYCKEKTIREIADELQVKAVTLRTWFDKMGIPRRNLSEASLVRFSNTSKEDRRRSTESARKVVATHIEDGTFWLGGRLPGKMTDEERASISERMRKNNPMHNESYAMKMRTSMEQVLRDRATPQELVFKEGLEQMGLEPKFQHTVGKAILDFAFLYLKIGVEIDGKFHYESAMKSESDSKRDGMLTSLGWRIIRVRNEDIENDLDSVLMEVRKVVMTE